MCEGFDQLSPNGIERSDRPELVEGQRTQAMCEGFDQLSPNGIA
jgi:hypothetical protein